jgi:uncharacterized linocin/CFP29 family protein
MEVSGVEYDFLMRDDAPFGAEVWSALDAAVVAAAKQVLVGRRFLPFTGPLGSGAQVIPVDSLTDAGGGGVSVFGEAEAAAVRLAARCWLQLPLLYKNFRLQWRDLETQRQFGAALDMAPAYAAGAACARLEDELIFSGAEGLGLPGLLSAEGRLTVKGGDMKKPGQPLKALGQAISQLLQAGSLEPYALVLHPEAYTYLFSIHPETGRLEYELIRERCQAGVFQSSAVPADKGAVISVHAHQLDLVVGLDMVCGYLGPEKLNHLLRVMETVALRIRKPSAICTIE